MVQQTALAELIEKLEAESKALEAVLAIKNINDKIASTIHASQKVAYDTAIFLAKALLPKEREQMEDIYNNHYALSPLSGKQFFDTNYTQE